MIIADLYIDEDVADEILNEVISHLILKPNLTLEALAAEAVERIVAHESSRVVMYSEKGDEE